MVTDSLARLSLPESNRSQPSDVVARSLRTCGMPQNPSVDHIPGPGVVLAISVSSYLELHCPYFSLGSHPPPGREQTAFRPDSRRPGLGLGYGNRRAASEMEPV